MKILFTGGGTQGHFYPIIAVIEEIEKIAAERRLIPPRLYFAGPDPMDRQALFDHGVTFVPTAAGKMRSYRSLRNFFDSFKTGWGVFTSVIRIFFMYPDVIFGKGGYASFPVLLAGKLFRIPVVIHESDMVPGRVSNWAGKFAERIAVSWNEAAAYFPKERVAHTGNPIRHNIMTPVREGAREYLKLEEGVPTILILGGSQGAQALNDKILEALPQLLSRYQLIHQVGERGSAEVAAVAGVVLRDNPNQSRYHPFPFLNEIALRMSVGAADLIISRAGSTIFEIATWGKPSILVPLPADVAHEDHQTKNAFGYARAGACVVIEQRNLTATLLISEIERILGDSGLRTSFSEAAKAFATPNAARIIAEELIAIGLSHE